MKERVTQTEALAAYLAHRPGLWIPMPELGSAIGAWAVHSRVADCRRRYGMHIDQKCEFDRATGKRLSYYRFQPANIGN